MTVSQIIEELTSGSQTNERTITIVPGWTCEDIADYLVREGAIDSAAEFLTLCKFIHILMRWYRVLTNISKSHPASAMRMQELTVLPVSFISWTLK